MRKSFNQLFYKEEWENKLKLTIQVQYAEMENMHINRKVCY